LPEHWEYMRLQLVVDLLKSCGYASPDPSEGRRFWRVPHEMRRAAQQMAEQLELDSMQQWRRSLEEPTQCDDSVAGNSAETSFGDVDAAKTARPPTLESDEPMPQRSTPKDAERPRKSIEERVHERSSAHADQGSTADADINMSSRGRKIKSTGKVGVSLRRTAEDVMAEEVVASPQLLPLRRRTQAKRLRKTHVTQDSDSEGDTAIDDVEPANPVTPGDTNMEPEQLNDLGASSIKRKRRVVMESDDED